MIINKLYLVVSFLLIAISCSERNTKSGTGLGTENIETTYTCPMHLEIRRNQPGNCPICNMKLVKLEEIEAAAIQDDSLSFILKPVDQQVLLKTELVSPLDMNLQPVKQYQGFVTVIPQEVGSITAKVAGRIEKAFVTYNFQQVLKGQKLFEIYSPELLTEENNLVFLLKSDPGNTIMISAAKTKLRRLGVSDLDLQLIEDQSAPQNPAPVYSSYEGFIMQTESQPQGTGMGTGTSSESSQLSIKEGSYIQKGQTIFRIINNKKLWGIISVPVSDLSILSVGDSVIVVPEADISIQFTKKIIYIEPVLNTGKKMVNVRLQFDNSIYKLPIGSQLSVRAFSKAVQGRWLPQSAIIDLGRQKAVLLRMGIGFKVKFITVTESINGMIHVISGVAKDDQVALNAQYIMDSESFIKE